MIRSWIRHPIKLVAPAILLVLALVVACGSSSTAAPTSTSAPGPTTRGAIPGELPTATVEGAAAVPTAIPSATEEPPRVVRENLRLIYAIGSVANETNRVWAGSRQAYIQFEPMLENLVSKDKETGLNVPRLATSWSADNNLRDWTFKLRKGVQFHDGWGEFTAKDVMHTLKTICRDDSLLNACGGIVTVPERGDAIDYESVLEIVDDYTIIFHSTRTNSLQLYNMGHLTVEMAILSLDFWEAEGIDGLDEKGIVGTNTYQYKGRRPGQSITLEKIDYPHWSGEDPDFQEYEVTWMPEDASRYAALLAGEINVVDLPIDLQRDSETQGMKLVRSRFTSNDTSLYFGGMNFASTEASKAGFVPDQPWNDVRVRQAMNLAINREELGEFLYSDLWEPMYVHNFHPTLEGWDPTWVERYEAEYKYDPERARALLAEAGYGPDNPVKVTALSYVSPGESEMPQTVEAITLYWNKVGIEAKLEDLDGAEVANRYRGRKMGGQVWPNIINVLPVEYWMRIAHTSTGPIHHYEDDFLDAKFKELEVEWRPEVREDVAREIGNHLFNNFALMPLFYFPHTIAVDPEVVEDWIFPGNTNPKLCCPAYAIAAR